MNSPNPKSPRIMTPTSTPKSQENEKPSNPMILPLSPSKFLHSNSYKQSKLTSSPIIPTLSLLISLPLLLFLLYPQFLPNPSSHSLPLPISPANELEDLSLFRRATSPSPKPSHLSSSSPKLAFLFLTNSDLHFAPLWHQFFRNTSKSLYNIYVHVDPTVTISPLTGVFQGRTIPSKKTQRGTATLISAARRLLANAIVDDSSNLYFALVSQNCIPLHSFDFVYNSLFAGANNGISYIEILSNETTLWDRYNARGKRVMLPEVPFDKFRVGSQFFVLSKRHSLLVLRDRRLWRKFRIPCVNVYSCYPEEHYFPTMLSMQDPKGCSEYTLTRVNWTGSVDGHPYTYQPGEVTKELIYRLRESNSTYSYLFARKFSPECLKPLLKLAKKVIFRD